MQIDWITNNPEAASKLRTADRAHAKALAAACNLPLAEKVAAYRKADAERKAAHALITTTTHQKEA